MGVAESDPEGQVRIAAFGQALRDLKWAEGNNLRIDIRWGTGDAALTKRYAAELVSLAPDVILGTNTPTTRALKPGDRNNPYRICGPF